MALTPVEIRHVSSARASVGYKRAGGRPHARRDRRQLRGRLARARRPRRPGRAARARPDAAQGARGAAADDARLGRALGAGDDASRRAREAETIVAEAHAEARAIARRAAAERERLEAELRRIKSLLRSALDSRRGGRRATGAEPVRRAHGRDSPADLGPSPGAMLSLDAMSALEARGLRLRVAPGAATAGRRRPARRRLEGARGGRARAWQGERGRRSSCSPKRSRCRARASRLVSGGALTRQDRRAGRHRAGGDRATARHGGRRGDRMSIDTARFREELLEQHRERLRGDDRAPRHRRRVADRRDRRALSARAPTTTSRTPPSETYERELDEGLEEDATRAAPRGRGGARADRGRHVRHVQGLRQARSRTSGSRRSRGRRSASTTRGSWRGDRAGPARAPRPLDIRVGSSTNALRPILGRRAPARGRPAPVARAGRDRARGASSPTS